MPWSIEKDHPSCPASKPYAVVKESDGEVEGCHATKESAEKQMAALYAHEGMMSIQHTPDIDVVRTQSGLVLRTVEAGEDSLGMLSGYFSAFDTWYEVDSFWEGTFLERVARGAFKRTIKEDRDEMRILFDHGFDPQIGNKVLAPIDIVREEDIGAYYEGPLFDTTYNRDLLPGLKRNVYGASMRMRTQEDQWNDEPDPSDYNPKGIPERTILRAKVMEFGPVTFPANPAATAGVRSGTDHFYERLRQRDAVAYEAVCRAAGRRPQLTGRSDAGSADGGDLSSDAQPGNGKASRIIPAAIRVLDVYPLLSKEHYRV